MNRCLGATALSHSLVVRKSSREDAHLTALHLDDGRLIGHEPSAAFEDDTGAGLLVPLGRINTTT